MKLKLTRQMGRMVMIFRRLLFGIFMLSVFPILVVAQLVAVMLQLFLVAPAYWVVTGNDMEDTFVEEGYIITRPIDLVREKLLSND